MYQFENGKVVGTEGTWLAGRDGLAAMIMPARPKVGDVYRPENIPGNVFEEVTVTQADVTLDGPRGPVPGSIVGSQLHQDATYSDKSFLPGYGEGLTGKSNSSEALAVFVPTDALPGGVPRPLQGLLANADGIFEEIHGEPAVPWAEVSRDVGRLQTTWANYRTRPIPPRLATQMDTAVNAIGEAARAHDPAATSQAAVDTAEATLDLQLQFKPPASVDAGRMDMHAAQVLVDVAANDPGGVGADVTAIEWVRERITHKLSRSERNRVDVLVARLRTAADRLRDTLDRVQIKP